MIIKYRKDYPFYGKFKAKINFNSYTYTNKTRLNLEQVISFLKQNFSEENYKIKDGRSLYLKKLDDYETFVKHYSDYIHNVLIPAPGYEHLEGYAEKIEKVLWHDTYPYKITLKKIDEDTYNNIISWLNSGCLSKYRHAGGQHTAMSIFFVNCLDVFSFKMLFADKILNEINANHEKALKELEYRISEAKRNLEDYIEGIKSLEDDKED